MGHIHEKIDFVVVAYIVNKGRVLLVDHKKSKLWLPVGGHVELDEDTDQALLREIKEECGLDVKILAHRSDFADEGVKPLLIPNFLDIHRISETHMHLGLGYIAVSESNNAKLAAEEHNSFRWFSKADLENPEFKIKENVRFYAKEALKIAEEK